MPLKLKKGEKLGKCTTKDRCKFMAYVLRENAYETLTEVSSINLRTGLNLDPKVVLRMKGGGLGPLQFCPWCKGTLLKLKKVVDRDPVFVKTKSKGTESVQLHRGL